MGLFKIECIYICCFIIIIIIIITYIFKLKVLIFIIRIELDETKKREGSNLFSLSSSLCNRIMY